MVRAATLAAPPAESEISIQASAIIARVDALQSRVDGVAKQNEASLRQFGEKIEELFQTNERRTLDFETGLKQTLRDGMEELRGPIDETKKGFAQLVERVGKVDANQGDLAGTLDNRLTEIAYQTRLAMVGGGLIVIAAIVVMLLK